MQQALEYAAILDVPFAYSSNGDAFLEHDRTVTGGKVEKEIPLDKFPSPDELWARYRAAKGYTANEELVVTQDYYDDGSGKAPRCYYQLVAINRTIDATDRFTAGGLGKCTTHPHCFFGKMTPMEWATLAYKHMDHHLRQFGV